MSPVTALLIDEGAAVRQAGVHCLGKPFPLPGLLGSVEEALWADGRGG